MFGFFQSVAYELYLQEEVKKKTPTKFMSFSGVMNHEPAEAKVWQPAPLGIKLDAHVGTKRCGWPPVGVTHLVEATSSLRPAGGAQRPPPPVIFALWRLFLSFPPIALGGFNRQWAALSNIYAWCSLPPYTHSHGAPEVCVKGMAPSFCSYLVWSEPVVPGWRAEGGQPAPCEDSPGFLLVWEACSRITKRGGMKY